MPDDHGHDEKGSVATGGSVGAETPVPQPAPEAAVATDGSAAAETPVPETTLEPAPETMPEPAPETTPEPAPEPEAEEDFAAMFAQSESKETKQARLEVGALVKGRVVAVGPETAFVALGGKAEAAIGLGEFRDEETGEHTLSIGDTVEATITDDGSQSGSIVLKRTFGRGGRVPGELEQALEHAIAIEGVVTGRNKGGFDVQVAGQRAFCPASQMDRRRGDGDPDAWIGQRLRFRVTKIESGGRNIVVSRRDLLEEEMAAQAAITWERLEVGAVVQGEVTSIREFGAFVDVGGVEGLVHISQLGHARVEHPSEVLEVGQKVETQVVKIEAAKDGGRAKIGLSIRALAADPWSTAAERYPAGLTARGKVRKVEAFGAFVELEPGLDGLVHVSAMSLDRRVAHPREVVKVGDEIDVTVVNVDPNKRRLGLSMVEGARQKRDEEDAQDRREAQVVVDNLNRGSGLGTFGDLLKRKK
ncbi:MAG: S1 RNA-binding domain-containing protein [Candidatus Binatia bacterium]|nr:S1 RNA-binding domain-containing protein [Candidatus Binatia bacterium]